MRLRRFSLPLVTPLRTARTELRRREGVAIALCGADGTPPAVEGQESPPAAKDDGRSRATVGVGEATPLPGWTESLPACVAAIRDARDARDACDARDARDAHDARDALAALDPAETPAARHGLALALADARARVVEEPLAATLADEVGLPAPSASVPVNATIGDGSPDETARSAARAVDEGYRCLKLKVGARGVDDDLDRVRAVRRRVGSGVTLRADANGGWDRPTARRALRGLEAFDVAVVEQPLPADDLAGLAALRGAVDVDVAVAVDESLAEHGIRAVLDADAADVAVVKPMALGGPDLAVEAARCARAAGVEPIVTTTIDAVIARTAAVHVAATIPDVGACGLATGPLLADDLAADPCPVDDGRIAVPAGPGLAGDAFDDVV